MSSLFRAALAALSVTLPALSFANIAPDNPATATGGVLATHFAMYAEDRNPGETQDTTIHRKFAGNIERNISGMNPARVAQIVDSLSDAELRDLAQAYANSNADFGRTGNLQAQFTARLDAKRAARVASFLNAAVPGMPFVWQAGQATMAGTGIGQFLNYTPVEIYLDYRTLPTGALTVQGALFETASMMGVGAVLAYQTGTAIGNAMDPLIQQYDPSLWDAIGGTVDGMLTNLKAATDLLSQGKVQQAMGTLFQLNSSQAVSESTYGGDLDNSAGWVDFSAGSGGGGCHGGRCPPIEAH